MARIRVVLGLIASTLLVLSSGAHSIMGLQQMQKEMRAAQVPLELEKGLTVGWEFGGMMMLVTGLGVGSLFLRRYRGEQAPLFPALVAGTGYLLFGLWAMFGVDMQPFYLVFVIPGLLLIFASRGQADKALP